MNLNNYKNFVCHECKLVGMHSDDCSVFILQKAMQVNAQTKGVKLKVEPVKWPSYKVMKRIYNYLSNKYGE